MHQILFVTSCKHVLQDLLFLLSRFVKLYYVGDSLYEQTSYEPIVGLNVDFDFFFSSM